MIAARHAAELVLLPPRVSLFYLRACALALRRRDPFALRTSTKPRELRLLLRAARGRHRVVEIGTGSAWTASVLALADPARQVVTIDRIVRPGRVGYLGLCPRPVRDRVELVDAAAEDADATARAAPASVDLLFVDGNHQAAGVIAALEAWGSRLAPGALVAFHDWDNPAYPGVREAIAQLELDGHGEGDLYLWWAPADR
jgi:predicted O-methyltransferase YrrM